MRWLEEEIYLGKNVTWHHLVYWSVLLILICPSARSCAYCMSLSETELSDFCFLLCLLVVTFLLSFLQNLPF